VNRLLKLTAIIEAATGLALMAVPSVVVRLLLGGEISGASVALGRVGGFALLSLGMACWPGRDSDVNAASAVRAMLAYNSLTTLYLLCLGIGGEWVGPLLWPAVALHGILSFLLARQWRPGNTGHQRRAAPMVVPGGT
jgi:hypothetical protein